MVATWGRLRWRSGQPYDGLYDAAPTSTNATQFVRIHNGDLVIDCKRCACRCACAGACTLLSCSGRFPARVIRCREHCPRRMFFQTLSQLLLKHFCRGVPGQLCMSLKWLVFNRSPLPHHCLALRWRRARVVRAALHHVMHRWRPSLTGLMPSWQALGASVYGHQVILRAGRRTWE